MIKGIEMDGGLSSYFTHEVPPRVDGSLCTIYDDSPFEKIVEWIRKNLPDADIRI